jgi:hypothetical protein
MVVKKKEEKIVEKVKEAVKPSKKDIPIGLQVNVPSVNVKQEGE